MHCLATYKSKDHYTAIKIDMEKTFDKVEWSLLLAIMQSLGFANKWFHWILQRVSTISYSILINESPSGFFKPTRGLRQGDPLSPFLFLLIAKALSRDLTQADEQCRIQGIKVSRRGPTFNHLLFAKDLFLFAKANDHKAKPSIKPNPLCFSAKTSPTK